MCPGVEVCNGCPGTSEPGSTECDMGAPCIVFLGDSVRVFNCLVGAQFGVERFGGLEGYGTLSMGCCWVLRVALEDVAAEG